MGLFALLYVGLVGGETWLIHILVFFIVLALGFEARVYFRVDRLDESCHGIIILSCSKFLPFFSVFP